MMLPLKLDRPLKTDLPYQDLKGLPHQSEYSHSLTRDHQSFESCLGEADLLNGAGDDVDVACAEYGDADGVGGAAKPEGVESAANVGETVDGVVVDVGEGRFLDDDDLLLGRLHHLVGHLDPVPTRSEVVCFYLLRCQLHTCARLPLPCVIFEPFAEQSATALPDRPKS